MTTKNTRWPLYGILGVFIVPMLIAFAMYFGRDQLHLGHVQHGTLMSAPFQKMESHHHWQIVHVTGRQCDESCQKLDHNLRQMWKLLGKEQPRVMVRREESHAGLPAERVYLADPAGNIFMYYPRSVNPMDILKDLKHLLKVSQIG